MMALARFNQGDTNYIAKHNANAAALEAELAALRSLLGASLGGAVSIGEALQALLGESVALIGADSYRVTPSGTTLSVAPGWCWRPSLGLVLGSRQAVNLSFAGQPAGTYYLQADANGAPIRSTNATEALYQVVWSGSSFTGTTRLAAVVWGAADQIAAQSSSALGATFERLDARLEAGEAKAVEGASAHAWVTGRLVKNVAGGLDVTLTAAEANAFAITFTGALTQSISVTLPLAGAPRGWVVENATSGGYLLTVKGPSGAGLRLAPGTRTWLMHDGVNLIAIGAAPHRPAVVALPFAPNLTADFSFADTVRVTLMGPAVINLTGAADGQRCVLALQQGGSGGHSVTFGPSVRLGTDLTLLTLSTISGKTDKLGFIFDAATGKFDAVAIMRGF